MATTFPTYPGTTFEQAVELAIFSSNQLHNIINGDSLSTVDAEDGAIPTVRKALIDNIYFKTPAIEWKEGAEVTVFNQLYTFSGGTTGTALWYAPTAAMTNVITMGTSPEDDDNWRLYGWDTYSKKELNSTSGASYVGTSNGSTVQDKLNSSLQYVGKYEDGTITITSMNDVIEYNGTRWYVKPSVTLPYTTTGNTATTWVTDSVNFIPVGDAALRQELFDTHQYIPWRTPQYHGAKGDGVTDDTAAITAMFTSASEDYLVPSGTYIISTTIKETITKNLRIFCSPGVVFKLADNARQGMFLINGDSSIGKGTNSFEWFGGEIDGNWSGQGEEPYASNGHFQDISHGLVVNGFYRVRIDTLYIHSFMGHHINHGGNTYFHAENIHFNSHTATNFPKGGSRGDGITGCSRFCTFRNIYGFTTDDMIAVFAGCTWIPGIGTGDALIVDEVDIDGVTPWYKTNDQDSTITTYTWNAVAVSNIGGYGIQKVRVVNVQGYTQYSDVRVGSGAGGSDSVNDYYGNCDTVIIDNIDVRVQGDSTSQHLYNMVRIGALYPSTYTNTYESIIKSLTISNVKCYPTGNNRTLIGIFNTTIYTVSISNITVNGLVADDTYNIVYVNSDRQIGVMYLNGVVHNPPPASTDTISQARLCVNWNCTYTGARSKLIIDGIPILRNAANTAYISNVLVNSGTYAPEIYSEAAVVRTPTNFYFMPASPGTHFLDRYLGRVSYGSKGMWEFDEWFTKWNSSTFGRPTEALMPGYSNITFVAGMSVKTVGSPMGEVQGWMYNGSTWQMIGGNVPDSQVLITPTWVPTAVTPYTTIHSCIYNVSGWPVTFGSITVFSGYTAGRSGAFQEIISSDGKTKYTRTWSATNSAWNTWYYTTLTAVSS